MSLSTIVDVAIGLVFTYALLGLIASALQETVAAAFKLRGRKLRDGIRTLIAGTTGDSGPAADLFRSVFGHSLISGLAPKGLPSYAPARNFSLALFDVLSAGSQAPLFSQVENGISTLPASPARETLTALVRQTGGDLDQLRAGVEQWYDDGMDRVSGDYKRFSHYFAIGFGFLVAVAFNVDSIRMADVLWHDPARRQALVDMASQYQAPKTGESTDLAAQQAAAKQARDQLKLLPAPIGWPDTAADTEVTQADTRNHLEMVRDALFAPGGTGILKLLGWLVTAFAVSLGAPFWFDMLQNLLNLRAAGPKPPRSDAPVAVAK